MDLNKKSFRGEEYPNFLLTLTTEGFMILDREASFVEANQAFQSWMGYDHDSLRKRKLVDLVPEASHETFFLFWAKVLEDHKGSSEFTVLTASGKELLLEMNFFHPSSSEELVCVFCKEISFRTDEKRLNQLKMQALATTANAVVITDAEGKIVWVNRAFSKHSGYSLDEALGEQPGRLVKSGKHSKSFYDEMWQTIQRGETWQGDILNRRKDGMIYPAEMTITPMFDELGLISNYIAMEQDVSEKKNLQEMLLRSQRLESIGNLASGVAHDLNNVLSPIVMSSDLLMIQTQDSYTSEMLQIVKDSAKRGAEIVRQLLNFARGESDEMLEIQIRHLLKQVIKVYRETFPRYITIEDRISADLHPIKGVSNHLHQVFTNLMINARDAMPEGGDLLLEAQNVHLDVTQATEIRGAHPGHFVRIRVKDTGTGIPPEIQDKIFKSFFTTKEIDKGTGLGLPTSKKIVEEHKGFIHFESTVGMGASFDVYLPVFEGVFLGQQPEEIEKIPLGKKEKLLVVDDEESIGFMLLGTLQALNYEVKVVKGGQEGLNWWRENREDCDLILLDMMMPGLDGADVMEELKQENCETQILIMSGMVSEEKLLGTGIDLSKSFIAKPFTILDLAKKIRLHLDD